MGSITIKTFGEYRYDQLLTVAKKWKPRRFGQVSRSSGLGKLRKERKFCMYSKRKKQKRKTEKRWKTMDFVSSIRALKTVLGGQEL